MIKILRNIRRKLLLGENFNSRFIGYLLYAIGEIILVVIGILIAIQINNWNNHRIQELETAKTYHNIKIQIVDDATELKKIREFNAYYSDLYVKANEMIKTMDKSKSDSLAIMAIGLSQNSNFHRSGNIYETLVNGGELKLLKNDDITRNLQKLEMTYNRINELEEVHWDVIMNELSPELKGVISYADLTIYKPEKLYSIELQNIFIESIFLTKGKEIVYDQALKEIDTLLVLIDKELDSSKVR